MVLPDFPINITMIADTIRFPNTMSNSDNFGVTIYTKNFSKIGTLMVIVKKQPEVPVFPVSLIDRTVRPMERNHDYEVISYSWISSFRIRI